jgi:hypothetical protein
MSETKTGTRIIEVIPYPMPMFSFRDPDGNTLYLVQRMPGQP